LTSTAGAARFDLRFRRPTNKPRPKTTRTAITLPIAIPAITPPDRWSADDDESTAAIFDELEDIDEDTEDGDDIDEDIGDVDPLGDVLELAVEALAAASEIDDIKFKTSVSVLCHLTWIRS
jgi:hypothetical protein